MVLLYTVGFGPYASRAIFGPLPGVLCKIGTFGMQFFGMNICLIAVAIGWSKLGFAYIYKTIPVMDDKFFATYIVANIHLVTLLAIGAKSVVDEKHMLSHEVSDDKLLKSLKTIKILSFFRGSAPELGQTRTWNSRTFQWLHWSLLDPGWPAPFQALP